MAGRTGVACVANTGVAQTIDPCMESLLKTTMVVPPSAVVFVLATSLALESFEPILQRLGRRVDHRFERDGTPHSHSRTNRREPLMPQPIGQRPRRSQGQGRARQPHAAPW